MDQKRLLLAIAASVGILLIFQVLNPKAPVVPAAQQQAQLQAPAAAPAGTSAAPAAVPGAPTDAATAAATPRAPGQRLRIEAPRVEGSLSLRGAMLDDLVLRDYRETVDRNSPLVRMLFQRDSATPYYAQWGFAGAAGLATPGPDTDWTASGPTLTPATPVTLSWDNGQGQVFEIALSLDDNFMVTAEQRVRNTAATAVQVQPWARVRRETTPHTQGYYILHEGFVGVLDGRLHEQTYKDAKSEAEKHAGVAFTTETGAGWAGFTDKYFLGAVAAVDPAQRLAASYRHNTGAAGDAWQVDFAPPAALSVAPGATAAMAVRLFAGAKEVATLDSYRDRLGIPDFEKAIDFGWFYFLTKPFFHALAWLYHLVGNFGIAILIFTLALKALFFPLANKAYKSMARMKHLGPKMTEIKQRHKDDPTKAQAEIMALYRTEKINPASGCLPIFIQIPVFFSLYKVLFVTIEMRHAPFFGWIHDLSAPDPTNLFNLFGLIPFDPSVYSSYLHMPAWALLMGITMFLQQKLNPQPPDPVQAKVFAWMPVIFTFMLASMPAGLVIYWSWNNLLSICQQYFIMQQDAAAAAEAKKRRQDMVASLRGIPGALRRLPGLAKKG